MNNHQMQQNIGSGLTRYRSAPSSYFANLLNSSSNGGFGADDIEQLFNPRETQRILSKFITGNSETIQEHRSATVSVQSQSQSQSQSKLNSPQLPPKPQQQLQRQRSSDYSPVMYQSINSDKEANSAMDSSFSRVFGNVNSNHVKTEPGYGNFGLTRHSSLPAGLFDNINIQKEVGVGVGVTSGANNLGTENSSNTERSFKSRMDYPSETGSKAIGETDQQFYKDNYIPDFPMNNWDDEMILCDDFLNDLAEDKPFSSTKASDVQNNEDGNRTKTRLSHHLSLPTSSAELSAIEKLLDEAVPFKIRAKRGCATHPRSIAERVRRTKISERMRKLQELVPNMEKQTNTSHMLDLAVDYIKDLQRQVKKLSDARAKCRCSAGEKW